MKRSYKKFDKVAGDVFGRLKYTGKTFFAETGGITRRFIEAVCECGVVGNYVYERVRRGETKSCGCFRVDTCKGKIIHGESNTDLYYVWQEMIKRCTKKYSKGYENYGGRGIKVFEEWMNSYVSFRDWARSSGYKKGLSIERIDNDGNYEPSNCKWAERPEQNRNTRRNKMIAAWGEVKCLFDWAKDERCKVSAFGLRGRYDSGNWRSMEKMISTPPNEGRKFQGRMIKAFGETKNLKSWVEDERCVVKLDALRDRINAGISPEIAMSQKGIKK